MISRKSVVLLIVLAAVATATGWFLVRETRKTGESLDRVGFVPVQIVKKPFDDTDLVDTSNWKTYRNEEYGFEFKLSEEYLISENDRNLERESNGVLILKSKHKEYLFSNRKGLELVKEVAGLGDAIDFWRVKIKVHPYSEIAVTDFEGWIKSNDDPSSIAKTDRVMLQNGNAIPFVSWNSFCSDYSAYFVGKNFIIEFNTCGTEYFEDQKSDYFSKILETVHF